MSLAIGDTAPGFSLPAVDGSTVTLDGLADRDAVAVVFSCNHCPYVIAWEDRLNEVARDYAPRGLGVVAVNANDTGKQPALRTSAEGTFREAAGTSAPLSVVLRRKST